MLLTAELAKARGMDGENLALFIHKYPDGIYLTVNSIIEANASGVIKTTWLIKRLLTAEERGELAANYVAPLFYYTDIPAAKQCATEIRTWSNKPSAISIYTIRASGHAARTASGMSTFAITKPSIDLAKKLAAFAIGTAGYLIGNPLATDHNEQLYSLMRYSLTARVMFEGAPVGQENKYKEQQLAALINKINNSSLVGL